MWPGPILRFCGGTKLKCEFWYLVSGPVFEFGASKMRSRNANRWIATLMAGESLYKIKVVPLFNEYSYSLTPALDRDGWLTSRCGCFTLDKLARGTNLVGYCLAPELDWKHWPKETVLSRTHSAQHVCSEGIYTYIKTNSNIHVIWHYLICTIPDSRSSISWKAQENEHDWRLCKDANGDVRATCESTLLECTARYRHYWKIRRSGPFRFAGFLIALILSA
jgi:hypothetical protein